jgi:uncharacterized membrane protein YeaQ/YmgE (transglycosylase-associated protein family)
MNWVVFIIVGLIAGWLAGMLMKGGKFGIVGNMAIGVAGSLIGTAIFQYLGIAIGGGLLGSIIIATIGAMVLIIVIRMIKAI